MQKINEIWLKASVLGTTWAASEIVLGSFLHNLRIPFSGNFLTAIGLIILISAAHKWKDKGLFWRAGIICATLKTMSPSAVIFGPIVAIIAEAFLLEFSVRLFGKNFIGFFIGSAFAMSWVVVQRLANFIIYYGFNIVELYSNLMKYIDKQLHTSFDVVWMPIFILFLINIFSGFISAWLGIKAGRELQKNNHLKFNGTENRKTDQKHNNIKDDFKFSTTWLFINFACIVITLYLINYSNIIVWIFTVSSVISIWAIRYTRALKQLSKPKFWIFFVAITLLSSFAFSASKSYYDAFYIGLQMNFRAAILIIGFSVLGKELYSPKIRNYFNKTTFRQLPLALDLSFQSLPFILANLPDVKTMLKNPMGTIQKMMVEADKRFEDYKNTGQHIFIITGKKNEGKTKFLFALKENLQRRNINVKGFLSLKKLDEKIVIGYELLNIENGDKIPFLQRVEDENQRDIGAFKLNNPALIFGESIFQEIDVEAKNVIIMDEVGKLELQNEGWAPLIDNLLELKQSIFIISVRDEFLDTIISQFGLSNPQIIVLGSISADDLAKKTASILDIL